jgi:hypothetical protein
MVGRLDLSLCTVKSASYSIKGQIAVDDILSYLPEREGERKGEALKILWNLYLVVKCAVYFH